MLFLRGRLLCLLNQGLIGLGLASQARLSGHYVLRDPPGLRLSSAGTVSTSNQAWLFNSFSGNWTRVSSTLPTEPSPRHSLPLFGEMKHNAHKDQTTREWWLKHGDILQPRMMDFHETYFIFVIFTKIIYKPFPGNRLGVFCFFFFL